MMSEMKAIAERDRRPKRIYAEMSIQNDLLKEAPGKGVKHLGVVATRAGAEQAEKGNIPWICAYLEIEPDEAEGGHGSETVCVNGEGDGATASAAYGHAVGKILTFPYIKPHANAPGQEVEVIIACQAHIDRIRSESAYDPINFLPRMDDQGEVSMHGPSTWRGSDPVERNAPMSIPATMNAMVQMGHGDLDQCVRYENWPTPQPHPGEILIKVAACGLNNTEVKYTRQVMDRYRKRGYVAHTVKTGGDVMRDVDRIRDVHAHRPDE